MTASEGTTTVKTRSSDIEVRAADGLVLKGRWWHRNAPAGCAGHRPRLWRARRLLPQGGGSRVRTGGFRRHRSRLSRPRTQPRPAGRRATLRRADRRSSATLDWAVKEIPGRDCFVLGHSNGGQVALRACLRNPGGAKGLILSNPVLRVSVQVPPLKMKVARFLARHAPWVTLKGNLNAEAADSRPRNPGGAPYRPPASQPDERAALLRHDRGGSPAHGGAQ